MATTQSTHATPPTLRAHVVCDITYRCELYKAVEAGTVTGYWTGEIDTWGKQTIQPATGGDVLYLFPREIVSVEAPSHPPCRVRRDDVIDPRD